MNQCKRKADELWMELYQAINSGHPYGIVSGVAPDLLVYTYNHKIFNDGYKWYCENCVKAHAYPGGESPGYYITQNEAYVEAVYHIEQYHPEYFYHELFNESV